MDPNVHRIIQNVIDSRFDSKDVEHIASMPEDAFASLVVELAKIAEKQADTGEDADNEPTSIDWTLVLRALVLQANRGTWNGSLQDVESIDPADALAVIYSALANVESRYQILTVLAKKPTGKSLRTLSRLFVEDPPQEATITAPLIPLFDVAATAVPDLYPALLEALSNPILAPAVLDLANFLFRKHQLAAHPASGRTEQLIRLAEAVVSQLEKAQRPPESTADAREAQTKIARSLPLAVSLCDTLGLVGDVRAVPTLEHMLELKHRRLRAEAAAALVRLGEERAIDVLCGLASEAPVRLRVLQYADELNCLDRMDDEWQLPLARAEAELVTYLSEPTQMGLPPLDCELIDQRTLRWPGYEEPRDCYLFRYSYSFLNDQDQPTKLSNIGIAGPLIHTFHADLAELPIEDIYAVFAGWHAEHEELQELAWDEAFASQDFKIRDLRTRLTTEFSNAQPITIGRFFGDVVLIANAERNGGQGTVVVDDVRTDWFPTSGRSRPIGPDEAFCLYKGRRLLSAFNPDFGAID